MAIFEVAIVAAPIAPHDFEPGKNIDDNSTEQISLSHGDLDAQTDEMISALPQKNLKSHFLSLQTVLKNFGRQRRAARRH